MTELEVKNNLIKGSIAWYPFVSGKRVLLIVGVFSEFEVLSDYLESINLNVDVIKFDDMDSSNKLTDELMVKINNSASDGTYDYIISAMALESLVDIKTSVNRLEQLLADDGKLLILADNRLAIRYFAGDKDLFSGHVLDGIDGYMYQNLEKIPGRGYSISEWENAVNNAGLTERVYGVFPSLFNANMIIAEGYQPNENLMERFEPYYSSPSTVYMDERYLYKTLQDNDLLVKMANGLFIECSKNGNLTDYNQITVQGNRDVESALVTYIKDDSVDKRLMWPDGNGSKLQSIKENSDYLEKHGVKMAGCQLEEGILSTEFVEGIIATEHFQNLIELDVNQFLKEFDAFVEILVNSSEHVPYEEVEWDKFDPYWDRRKADDPNKDYWKNLAFGSDEDRKHIGPILRKGFIDLSTINCIKSEEDFVFFDQEFFVNNFTAKSLIYRSICFIYMSRPKLGLYLPMDELLERYDLIRDREVWAGRFDRPLREILHSEKTAITNKLHSVDYRTISANRMRMDYSQEDYEKYFSDIFKDVFEYKCYIFGSGIFAKKFIELYGSHLNIAGVLDNNSLKWGQFLSLSGNNDINIISDKSDIEIEIMSPEVLKTVDVPYKVFICIKDYDAVLKQLKKLGATKISIYNPKVEYPLPRKLVSTSTSDNQNNKKKYNVGYVAGVFDLFHLGHVNLLRRAKEQCNHLIVGVVSDEQVMNNKKTKPYYSFEDRIEIIRACRYVDEAVKIPFDRSGTEDAYRMYRFDAQFSGSDYENDPYWLSAREYLRQHGSELVFFPYTESVSSTKVKEQIKDNQ